MGCYEFDEWNLSEKTSAIALISLRNYNLEFRKQSMLEKNMKYIARVWNERLQVIGTYSWESMLLLMMIHEDEHEDDGDGLRVTMMMEVVVMLVMVVIINSASDLDDHYDDVHMCGKWIWRPNAQGIKKWKFSTLPGGLDNELST